MGILTVEAHPRDGDNGHVVVQVVRIPVSVHSHVGGGDPGAPGEEEPRTEYDDELARLASTVPPAVSGGHRPVVGEERRSADGGCAGSQSDHESTLASKPMLINKSNLHGYNTA